MSDAEKDPSYVTRAECAATTSAIRSEIGALKEDMQVIRTALVGKDMRGGLVKDVAEMKKGGKMSAQILHWILTFLLVILAYVLGTGKFWP